MDFLMYVRINTSLKERKEKVKENIVKKPTYQRAKALVGIDYVFSADKTS